MAAFRRVDAREASASAVGILIPLGESTSVIVRPRSLNWDLLPARWDGSSDTPPVFCQFSRDQAAAVARQLPRQLEDAAIAGRNPIETFGKPGRYQVWLRLDDFVWILCRRSPGQAYQPALFTTQEDARNAGLTLCPLLCPAPDAQQEVYFNTQKFADPRAG